MNICLTSIKQYILERQGEISSALAFFGQQINVMRDVNIMENTEILLQFMHTINFTSCFAWFSKNAFHLVTFNT